MDTAPPSARRGWSLALTALASFTVALDGLVTATALTSIQRSFGATLAELQWTTNAYNLSFAVLLSVGAALGDRFGRRRVFVAGLLLFALASICCAMSGDITALIAARTLQGAGAAMVMPVAMALLSVAYPVAERGKALGLFSGITGLAVLSGPVIGGAIAEGMHWTWIFWINVPLTLILIPFALIRLDESKGDDLRLDVVGVLLVGGLAFGAAWGLIRGTEIGWMSAEVLASLAAALALCVAFVVWERRTPTALLPPELVVARGFVPGVAAAFFLYAGLYGTVFFAAQFLQVGQGHGPMDAGLRLLPWTATVFIIAPIAGSLVNKLGERVLVVSGLVLNVAGLLWLALIASVDIPVTGFAPALIVAGVGVSLAMPSVQSALMRNVAQRFLGKASGAFNMSRFLGGVFGVAAGSIFLAAYGSYATPEAFTAGFSAAILTMASLAGIGAIIALALPRRVAAVAGIAQGTA